MFYLRRISGNGVQMNFDLGESYTLIDKEVNPEEFSLHRDHVGWVDEKTYAFVTCHSCSKIYQLYDGEANYIMTDGGKTFSNLTKSYGVKENTEPSIFPSVIHRNKSLEEVIDSLTNDLEDSFPISDGDFVGVLGIGYNRDYYRLVKDSPDSQEQGTFKMGKDYYHFRELTKDDEKELSKLLKGVEIPPIKSDK